MARLPSLLALTSLLSLTPLYGEEQPLEALNRILQKHHELEQEIYNLKKLLGDTSTLTEQDLSPLEPLNSLSEKVKIRTSDGITSYREREFEKAKESFRLAWEHLPSSYITNYNLGVAYYQLGNKPLAKKLFKTALETNKEFPGSERIEAILYPKAKKEDTLTDSSEEDSLNVEMENLVKESDTYLKSPELNYSQKMQASVRLLEEMLRVSNDNKNVIRQYYLKIATNFAFFEMYTHSLEVLNIYQNALNEEVLPDQYYSQVLVIEEKKKAQDLKLATLQAYTPELEIKEKLNRDLNELEIFATQLDEFVENTNEENSDFKKLCERLGEYRWGNKDGKHVLIVDRFQNLLYSSLSGTLPIDRYQDTKGEKFLKNITLLSDRLKLKQAEYFPVNLRVRHATIPYIIMYTFSPKHQAFIIVRLPREDMT